MKETIFGIIAFALFLIIAGFFLGAFFSVGGVFDTSDSGEMYVRMGVFVFLLCYVIRVTFSGDKVLFPWMKQKKE